MYERLESHTSFIERELSKRVMDIGALKVHLGIEILRSCQAKVKPTEADSKPDEVTRYEKILESVEHGLRQLCSGLEVDVIDQETNPSRALAIHTMLISLKSLMIKFTKEKNEKNEEFFKKGENDTAIREEFDKLCTDGEMVVASAYEQVTRIEKLKRLIAESEISLQSKSKEIYDLETRLLQMEDQQKKSELKYEQAKAEIESCQNLAIELKKIIINKVRIIILLLDQFTPSSA